MSSIAKQIVVCSTGVVIQILPLQLVVLTLKTVLPVPEPTMPATPLFLGDSLSLPEIETLWVNKSETNSKPHKRMKTNNTDQGNTDKITEGKLMIALCELRVLSMQAFLKDLKVHSSQMAWFIEEQLGELKWLKRVFNEM